ncbi:MAG: hypothetical protein AB7O68_22235 [Pirellulales bacterium]
MKALVIGCALLHGTHVVAAEWTRLPALPATEGVAGAFAGVDRGALLVAGGANFPDRKPWEGGTKVWYDTVFVLEKPDGDWKIAGRLPRPLGYGVSLTHRAGVVCIGGSDAKRHFADAFRLQWQAGKLITTELPSLPSPVANAGGALVGDTVYVAGGLEQPDAVETLRTVYRLDLSTDAPRWEAIESWPGSGRMLAVASGFDGAFWLAGGTELVADQQGNPIRRYLKDAYRYDRAQGWRRIADLPRAVVAAPSPAPVDETGFFVLGGDDGSQLEVAPDQHRGFSGQLLRYNARQDTWSEAGQTPAAHVTTPCVEWNERWVVPSGEVRPGIRSPEVWAWSPRETD